MVFLCVRQPCINGRKVRSPINYKALWKRQCANERMKKFRLKKNKAVIDAKKQDPAEMLLEDVVEY